MTKKIFAIVGTILVIGGFVFYLYSRDGVKTEAAVQLGGPTDVRGTRSGTSTTGVYSAGAYATTSYITKVNSADEAIYTINIQEASTTPGLFLSFWGSNDYDCDTATTSTIYNGIVKMVDINWYDVGTHLANYTGSLTIPAATTTLNLMQSGARKVDVTLKNLNFQCLKVDVSASSTKTHIQVKTRSVN